ncbi:sulfatase-like hydrolase/transferase [Natronomonas amylolytica]|uniref:sulfatase-like hydrolase/transferase n=1 Tax=Natronomonas amylolytica TaxID=3108498 RepID=UPI00300A6136
MVNDTLSEPTKDAQQLFVGDPFRDGNTMQPNILLIILDSVRARNTSLHGHINETTPFLSSLAKREATWYSQARSPAATSLTSHASIFTGRPVPEHGVTTTEKQLEPGHSIFEKLSEQGYSTAVFSENTWITNVDAGLNRFDTVYGPQNIPFPDAVDPREFVAKEGRGQYLEYLRSCFESKQPLRSLANGAAIKLAYDFPSVLPNALDTGASGAHYIDAFLNWQARQTEPWAVCLNLMDAHIPYEPDDAYDQWGGDQAREIQNDVEEQKWEFAGGQRPWWEKKALEGLYDGSILQLDSLLKDLVEELETRDVLDKTFLVITADHGEGFGEPSNLRPVRIAEHNVAIHECLTHVPLVVRAPNQKTPKRIDEPVSLDSFPRAVERLLEEAEPSFVTDEPVVSTAVGVDKPKQARAEPYVDTLSPYTATSRAVYEADDGRVKKYVTWREEEQTVEIVSAQNSFVVSENGGHRVEDVFGSFEESAISRVGHELENMSDSTQKQLEDLGYI